MRKLTLAAALLAAGMMTFAANAKEASKPEGNSCPYLLGCGASQKKTSDKKPTSNKTNKSASSKERPVLKAKARKSASTTKAKAASAAAKSATVKKGGKSKTVAAKARKAGKVAANSKAAPRRQFSEIVSRYASSYGVPASLAHAVISIESSYRADARGSAGEVGLMQIKPSTARMMGYSGSIKGLFNPETNIKYGIKYLAQAQKLGGGTTCGTILKYNAGHGATRMNPVSAAYCSKVKRQLGG